MRGEKSKETGHRLSHEFLVEFLDTMERKVNPHKFNSDKIHGT